MFRYIIFCLILFMPYFNDGMIFSGYLAFLAPFIIKKKDLNLKKIYYIPYFLIIIFSSLSNLLIDHYDINSRSKISSFYEICFMPIFFILVYCAIINKSIFIFALSILLKDMLLFLIRVLNTKQEIFDKKIIFISLFLSTLAWIFSFYSIEYFYYLIFFQLIVLIKMLPIKKLIIFYNQN